MTRTLHFALAPYESDTLRGNLGLPFPVNRYMYERELASV